MLLVTQIRAARAPLYAFAGMGVLWGSYAAMVPDTKAMLGVNDAVFGSLMLATPIAAVVAMLAAPKVAPLFGQHVLPLATVALALCFALPGQFVAPAFFVLAMVLVGAVNGFLDVTMNARVAALETEQGLHLMNLAHAAYSFGYAGAAIATGLARSSGYGPGVVLGAAALAVALFAFVTIERGVQINGFARGSKAGRGLGMVPIWGGIIVMVAFMAENAAESWSALHIERTLGGSPSEGGFGPALLALVMGTGRMAGQVLVARIDEARLLRVGAVVAAFGLVLTGLAPSPLAAYAGLVVMGIGASVIAPTAFALVGRRAAPEARAHAIVRATALGYMGYFFGPPALGLISHMLGLRFSFVVMAVMLLGLLAVIPLLFRTQPRLIRRSWG